MIPIYTTKYSVCFQEVGQIRGSGSIFDNKDDYRFTWWLKEDLPEFLNNHKSAGKFVFAIRERGIRRFSVEKTKFSTKDLLKIIDDFMGGKIQGNVLKYDDVGSEIE